MDDSTRLESIAATLKYHGSVLWRNKLGLMGAIVLLVFVLMALFAPMIAPHDPQERNYQNAFAEPSSEYPLGTDNRGRGIFSQLIHATQPAIIVGALTAIGVALLGTLMGTIAGYYGGYVDDFFMRVADFAYGLPLLPLLIITVTFWGSSLISIAIAISLLLWRGTARVIRSRVLTIKEKPYIKSVRASGASDARIMSRHVLPNVFPLTFLYGSFAVGWAILAEANISFLGFGDPSRITWGKMLLTARQSNAILLDAWWWFISPGIMIMLFVISVFVVSRTYEEELNPELSETEL